MRKEVLWIWAFCLLKSFLLVLHLSLCFVPAYFKFDSIIDSFIKWAEIDHEEKEDWLKKKMNKAEEEEEECVKAEKIVNQESSKRGSRIIASKLFWFGKYFFIALFRIKYLNKFPQTISMCQGPWVKCVCLILFSFCLFYVSYWLLKTNLSTVNSNNLFIFESILVKLLELIPL